MINLEDMKQLVPVIAKNIVHTYNYNYREKDDRFIKIQELIKAKREFLMKNQQRLRVISKQNQFLDIVTHDYNKYYTYIQKQKREQIQALQLLDNYIKDLTVSGKLSEQNLEDAKVEQSNILRELDSIKYELDSIVLENK